MRGKCIERLSGFWIWGAACLAVCLLCSPGGALADQDWKKGLGEVEKRGKQEFGEKPKVDFEKRPQKDEELPADDWRRGLTEEKKGGEKAKKGGKASPYPGRKGDKAGGEPSGPKALGGFAEVGVYRNLNCFNIRAGGPRLCADWEVRQRGNGSVVWGLTVTDIEVTKQTFQDSRVFSPSLRRAWIDALEKGRKWAEVARDKRVDMVKEIGPIGSEANAVFVSTGKGGYTAVRFGMNGWLATKAVYMYVPYGEDAYSSASINAFLRGFATAGERMRKVIEKRERQRGLFK